MSQEIIVQANPAGLALADPNQMAKPAFVQQTVAADNELLAKYISPPRIRISQGTSPLAVKEKFYEGEVYTAPNLDRIATVAPGPEIAPGQPGKPTTQGLPFFFVPLFGYTEYIAWNPQGDEQKIHARTLDPRHEVARIARDPDLAKRTRMIEGKEVTFLEHINYIVMVLGAQQFDGSFAVNDEYMKKPSAMSFAKTSFAHGRQLATLINARNAKMYGCVFQGKSTPTTKDNNTWNQIVPTNPPQGVGFGMWMSNLDWYNFYEQKHEELKANYHDGLLQVDAADSDTKTNPDGSIDAQYEPAPAANNAATASM